MQGLESLSVFEKGFAGENGRKFGKKQESDFIYAINSKHILILYLSIQNFPHSAKNYP